jgi:hypothetical protein
VAGVVVLAIIVDLVGLGAALELAVVAPTERDMEVIVTVE